MFVIRERLCSHSVLYTYEMQSYFLTDPTKMLVDKRLLDPDVNPK